MDLKQKNLLDLTYDTYLVYFNTSIILVISSFISIFIGTEESWSIKGIITALVILFLIITVLFLILNTLSNDIKRKLERL